MITLLLPVYFSKWLFTNVKIVLFKAFLRYVDVIGLYDLYQGWQPFLKLECMDMQFIANIFRLNGSQLAKMKKCIPPMSLP